MLRRVVTHLGDLALQQVASMLQPCMSVLPRLAICWHHCAICPAPKLTSRLLPHRASITISVAVVHVQCQRQLKRVGGAYLLVHTRTDVA